MSGLGKAVALGRINLLRQVRDRSDLFFVFVLPTILIFALGLQFGSSGRARLGIVAPAGDPSAEALVTTIAEDPTRFDVRVIADRETLTSQVERGQLEGGLVIPDGFDGALRGSDQVEIEYLGTIDSLTIGLRAPLEAAVERLGAITTAARVSVAEDLGSWDEAEAAATDRYASVPGIEVHVTQVGQEGMFAGFSQFTFGASTMLVMFTFLTSMTAAGRLVTTKQLGLSRRMTATPTSTWTIIGGEALGRYLVALLQAAFIVLVTAIVFNVSWGDPLTAGALVAMFALVSAAAALLVGAVARNPDQASSLGVFLGLALGALGGCMIPFQVMPSVMQSLARFIPHSWALLGLQETIRDGTGIETALPNLAVLAVFAAVLLALATWRFRRSITG